MGGNRGIRGVVRIYRDMAGFRGSIRVCRGVWGIRRAHEVCGEMGEQASSTEGIGQVRSVGGTREGRQHPEGIWRAGWVQEGLAGSSLMNLPFHPLSLPQPDLLNYQHW